VLKLRDIQKELHLYFYQEAQESSTEKVMRHDMGSNRFLLNKLSAKRIEELETRLHQVEHLLKSPMLRSSQKLEISRAAYEDQSQDKLGVHSDPISPTPLPFLNSNLEQMTPASRYDLSIHSEATAFKGKNIPSRFTPFPSHPVLSD